AKPTSSPICATLRPRSGISAGPRLRRMRAFAPRSTPLRPRLKLCPTTSRRQARREKGLGRALMQRFGTIIAAAAVAAALGFPGGVRAQQRIVIYSANDATLNKLVATE